MAEKPPTKDEKPKPKAKAKAKRKAKPKKNVGGRPKSAVQPLPKKPRLKTRRYSPLTEERFQKVLKGVAEHSNLLLACRDVNVNYQTVRDRRKADPEIQRRYEEAKAEYGQRLEDEARRRAVEGVEQDVYGGVGDGMTGVVGRKQVYSDTLLLAMLKRHANYADKVEQKTEHSGAVSNGPTIDTSKLDNDEKRALLGLLKKMEGTPDDGTEQ